MNLQSETSNVKPRMALVPALEVLSGIRSNQVVVTSMGAAREWPKLSRHALDFHFVPSSMGQAPALALGIALAQPEREVWCINGDGALLMNLGCLVTIVGSGAANFTMFLLENGVYEVTGGQQTAGCVAGADFPVIAHGAGFKTVVQFEDLAGWQSGAAATLSLPGPRFITLAVEPVREGFELTPPGPIAERAAQLKAALATTV